jgi:Xaa-Pro aminopeptidase
VKLRNRIRVTAFALVLASASLAALDYPVMTPNPAAYKARREKFMAQMPPKSVAILRSAPERNMSNDVEYLYRQNSDFFYLTGIVDEQVTIVLRPDAPDGKKYIAFVRPRDPRRESSDGARVGPNEAVAAWGVDAVYEHKDFDAMMSSFDRNTYRSSGYLAEAETLYLMDGDDDEWLAKFRESYDPMQNRRSGPAAVVDARQLIRQMRLIKDEEDVRFLRRAAEMSAQGHIRAMQTAAPGKWEFEVQEAHDGYCARNGSRRMAYPSIAGSGPNSCTLHYHQSDRQMKDGEVLLNDSGCEYGLYATDITRTYPVNGKFTPEQRAIYDIVLAAQKNALAVVKPGVMHSEVEDTAALTCAEGLVKLGLLQGDPKELVKTFAHRKFTLHGVSHWVGFDVHDPSPYSLPPKTSRPLEAGMVFTIEPGIYIPANSQGVDPKWWNIGVRIEDTILVSPTGSDCLSCAAPKETAEVEKAVQSGKRAAKK